MMLEWPSVQRHAKLTSMLTFDDGLHSPEEFEESRGRPYSANLAFAIAENDVFNVQSNQT